MSNFEEAEKFFHACEGLEGVEGCKQYVADGATFSAQCEPLVGIDNVLDYCDWMEGLGKGPLAGCGYVIRNSAYDDATDTAIFYGHFTGSHVADGGPVPPTQKETNSDYVYVLKMADGKVTAMTKIWNAPWALAELGWA